MDVRRETYRDAPTTQSRPVPIQLRHRGVALDRAALARLVNRGLDAEHAPEGDGLGVILAGDRLVRQLNRDFRGKDQTTDVLSFTNEAPDLDPEEPRLLGEIIISLPQCARQAAEQAVPPGKELVRLVVHGLLHVLGYDHIEAQDRAVMVPRERQLREWARRNGIGVDLLRVRGVRTKRTPKLKPASKPAPQLASKPKPR